MSILAAICIAGPITEICTQTMSLSPWIAFITGSALGLGFATILIRLE
jgi:hypothetical protein